MGLAQREFEAAGISTVALSNIPDLTHAVGAPRVVGIERPFGRHVGEPRDGLGQREVLLETLEAAYRMDVPGTVYHIQRPWKRDRDAPRAPEMDPPPIHGWLKTHPWQIPRLINRDPPVHP